MVRYDLYLAYPPHFFFWYRKNVCAKPNVCYYNFYITIKIQTVFQKQSAQSKPTSWSPPGDTWDNDKSLDGSPPQCPAASMILSPLSKSYRGRSTGMPGSKNKTGCILQKKHKTLYNHPPSCDYNASTSLFILASVDSLTYESCIRP